MGRPKRAADGGLIYHVLNRANARMTIFQEPEDYAAFVGVLEEAVQRTQTRLLAYCVLPTHWHLVLWPQEDGELSRFTGWLTLTHTQRWHAHRRSTGSGHVYQGRFKSFPVQDDEHFLTVCRYVERNALRANLVRRGRLALGKPPPVAARRRGRSCCWPPGRCGVWPGGWNRSMPHKRRPSCRPCGARRTAAAPSATRRGPTRSYADWAWRVRFAPKAAPRSRITVPDTFYL